MNDVVVQSLTSTMHTMNHDQQGLSVTLGRRVQETYAKVTGYN